jgi:hypothetical protein
MKMNVSRLLMMLVPFCLLWLSLAAAADQGNEGRFLYQWTDEQGNAHITNNLENVPAKYRSKVSVMGQPESTGTVVEDQQVQPPSSSAVPSANDAAETEAKRKEEWQNRMRDAKRRLENAVQQYQQLEQRKAEITAQWGASGAALPPQEVLDTMNQIENDMQRTRKEIDDIKNEINIVIPDEARKAGVPPGWLREVQ